MAQARRDAALTRVTEEEAIGAYLHSVLPAEEQDETSSDEKKKDKLVLDMLSGIYMSEGHATHQQLWSAATFVLPGVTRTPAREKVISFYYLLP